MTSLHNRQRTLDDKALEDRPSQRSSSSSESDSTVQQMKHEAQDKAQGVRHELSAKMSETTDSKTTELAERVEPVADVIRSASEQLREKGSDAPARAVEMLAEKMDDVSRYLREGDTDAFIADIQHTARQRPWLVAAGAFGVGMAVSRFLKASAEKDEHHSARRQLSEQHTARVETTPILNKPMPTSHYTDRSVL